MMSLEPPYQHGTPGRTGVILINLGTPDAPTAAALRPYLKQFLSDPRVVEVPRLIWWFILNVIILNTRPKDSAEKYAKVWMPEGSPLRVHTERQTRLIRELLHTQFGPALMVDFAMGYGSPSVSSVVEQMRTQGCERFLIVPLFPQYAGSSTGSVFSAVFSLLSGMRNIPSLRTIRHYHDHPGYIAALAQNIRDYWQAHGIPDKLVISFHGVPRDTLDKGDPYHCECLKTGRLLAEALALDASQYQVCFQSRFGKAEWLKPYTAGVLEELGRQKTRRIDVVCPGFVADCLETLEEIGMEGRDIFLQAGGQEYHAIPCLNEHPDWIRALGDIITTHLQGWTDPLPTPEETSLSKQRAVALGAAK